MAIDNPAAAQAEEKYLAHDFQGDAAWKEIENNLDFSAIVSDKNAALEKRKRKYFQKTFVSTFVFEGQ
jgi:hypothetical protein